MYFYRSITTIKALTFDLDDTLYDNAPFMAQAEAALINSLAQYDGLKNTRLSDFNKVKLAVLESQPNIYHDVLVWRAEAIKQFLYINGIQDKSQQEDIIDTAMHDFIFWRNKVVVPQQAIDMLVLLSKKYPLAVITNGNAEITKIGLSDYFQFSLRAGPDGLAKPYPDMFKLAAERLAIAPQNILHIGDNLFADVIGAINGGMQACWLNTTNNNIYQHKESKVLPHIEITQLSELNNLL